MAFAGSGLLAGCSGDGDGDGGDGSGTTTDSSIDPVFTETTARTTRTGEDDTTTQTTEQGSLDHVEQEFETYIDRPMSEIEKVNFFHLDTAGFYRWEHLTNEIPVFGPWCHSDFLGIGEMNYRLYEDVVSEPGRLEITVRDDARWSNGDEITGRDVVIEPVVQRLSSGQNTFEDVSENGPANVIDTITDYDYDGKTGTLYSDGDGFGTFVEEAVWLEVLVEHAPRYPTHLDPWQEFADRMFDVMDQAVEGEVDPWASDDPTLDEEVKTDIWGADREEMYREYRDPDNVVTNGAWTLDEIQGDQTMFLVPNPEHRHADQINFDRVRLEYIGAPNLVWTNLQTGRFDMAMTAPPPDVAGEFSDKYDTYLAPDDNGASLVCNGKHELVGKPRVRQALSTVLDRADICDTYHPDTWIPSPKPGDTFAKPAFLDDAWFDENLQDYSSDLEFAAELMREAGYERNSDDVWVDGDGNSAQLELAFSGEVPGMADLIIQQFNQFGVEAEVIPLEPTLYHSELEDGNLSMYSGTGNSGSAYTTCTQWSFMAQDQNMIRAYGWIEQNVDAAIQEMEWTDDGYLVNLSPDAVDHLTVQAPPVGEFWGELQTYRPVEMAVRLESRAASTSRTCGPNCSGSPTGTSPASRSPS